MKIIIYCQHVLGLGHFFRTLEIAKAMKTWQVILVTGGGRVDAALPDHVRPVELSGLMMDKEFTNLYSIDPEKTVDEVKHERKLRLLELIKLEKPDLFLIELYPFGRRAFRFELTPVLDYLKDSPGLDCKVVCSLRDILVEKQDPEKYETRVIDALNKWFDAVLVHSDPKLIKLESTFSRLDLINVPLFYTGFVTPVPDMEKVRQIRLEPGADKKLIVASAGGGNVGARLLKSVVQAYNDLPSKKNVRLKIYTGPYMDDADKSYLKSFECEGIEVSEFADNFVSLLGACDLSISMAGYNTCMNIAAANVPSLVWPFSQNREQMERAKKISRYTAPMTILEDQDLIPARLAKLIQADLNRPKENLPVDLNINGAVNTMKWVKEQINP